MEANKTLLDEKKADLTKLIEEKKKLEGKIVDNTKKLNKLEKEVKELEVIVANEERELKEEVERLMRLEIEKRVREEMEIKRKVEEEMNRIQSIDDEDKKKRKKDNDDDNDDIRIYTCSVCREEGHNKATCPQSVVEDEEKKKKDPKRKSIPKAVKTSLWNIHIGEDKAKGDCSVCKSEIKITNFEAGHIISHSKGGEDGLDNLLPICSLCNKSMGTENLIDYKIKYYSKVKKD